MSSLFLVVNSVNTKYEEQKNIEINRIKIAKLKGCLWEEQKIRLINPIGEKGAALSIDGGSKALLCFPFKGTECEIFDTKTIVPTFSTKFSHQSTQLAFYTES